jgi:hypothetical protein
MRPETIVTLLSTIAIWIIIFRVINKYSRK